MRYTYAADLQATNAPKLWTSKNERRQYGTIWVDQIHPATVQKNIMPLHWHALASVFAFSDDFASLYAMITAIDKIEKAYMNSAVASAAYDASCSELIAKFKTLRTVTEDSVPDVQHFMWVSFIFERISFVFCWRSLTFTFLHRLWRVKFVAFSNLSTFGPLYHLFNF